MVSVLWPEFSYDTGNSLGENFGRDWFYGGSFLVIQATTWGRIWVGVALVDLPSCLE